MYKKYFDGKKAIFFDLDGTLAETKLIWDSAFLEVAKDKGLNSNPNDILARGYSVEDKWDYAKKTFPQLKKQKTHDLVESTNDLALKNINSLELEPKEGFIDFLYEIKMEKNLKVAVISNSKTEIVMEELKKMGLEKSFDLVIGGDKVKKPKPDPQIYKKALSIMKLSPKDVLAFEDSISGVEASIKAGIDTIVIWDASIPRYDYHRKVLAFFPNFAPLVGNLDIDGKEYFVRDLEKREQLLKTYK